MKLIVLLNSIKSLDVGDDYEIEIIYSSDNLFTVAVNHDDKEILINSCDAAWEDHNEDEDDNTCPSCGKQSHDYDKG